MRAPVPADTPLSRLTMAAAAAAPRSLFAPAAGPLPGDRAPALLLLIEENPADRSALATALTRAGYCVLAFADSQSALSTYLDRSGEIDLVLFSQILPGRRASTDRFAVPAPAAGVLFLSGLSREDATGHRHIPRTRLVRMPLVMDEVLTAVQELLSPDSLAGLHPPA